MLDEDLTNGTLTKTPHPTTGQMGYWRPNGQPARQGYSDIPTNDPRGYGTSAYEARRVGGPGTQVVKDANNHKIPDLVPDAQEHAFVLYVVPTSNEWRPVTYYPDALTSPAASPSRAIAMQFATWFNADELPELSSGDLAERARDSGVELVQKLGPDAPEAAGLLRAMVADPSHPLYGEIEQYSLYGWNSDDETLARFRPLATAMADSIDGHIA